MLKGAVQYVNSIPLCVFINEIDKEGQVLLLLISDIGR